MKNAVYFTALLGGGVFGFVLSRAGATTYDYYPQLFLFQDLQLLWVICAAAGLGAVGVAVLKKFRGTALIGGAPIAYEKRPYTRTLIAGSIIFGLGWGGAGACPGTALAMLGEGKLGALFTIAGLTIGTLLYGVLLDRRSGDEREPAGTSTAAAT